MRLHISHDVRSLLCGCAAALIGLACMWRLSHVIMDIYWRVGTGAPIQALGWQHYTQYTAAFVMMIFLGFYLPMRWDRQQREEYKKNRPKKQKIVNSPRPSMRDTPWKKSGSDQPAQ